MSVIDGRLQAGNFTHFPCVRFEISVSLWLMEYELRQKLLATAAAYGRAFDIGLSSVARRCRNDSGFFRRIADPSKSFTARTFDEVMQWFSDNWPVNAAWPALVARPGSVNAPKTPSPDSTADHIGRSDRHPTLDTERSLEPTATAVQAVPVRDAVGAEHSSQNSPSPAPAGVGQT